MSFVDVNLQEGSMKERGWLLSIEIKPTIVESKLGNNNMVDMMLVLFTILSKLSCFH